MPQIHDILPLPTFAYEPELWLWALAVVLGLIAVLLFKLRGQTSKINLLAFDQALTELQQLALTAHNKQTLARACLLTKRLIGALGGPELISLSSNELSSKLLANSSHSLKSVFQLLSQLDQLRYQPDGQYDQKQISDMLYKICSQLISFKAEVSLEGRK